MRWLLLALLAASLSSASGQDAAKPGDKPGAEPVKVVFPTAREFRHTGTFDAERNDVGLRFWVSSVTDKGVIHDAIFYNVRATDRISSSGFFLFIVPANMAAHMVPAYVTKAFVKFDDQKITLEAVQDKSAIEARFTLQQFSKFVAAKSITITVGRKDIVFDHFAMEGLREIASMLPDGITSDGEFVVSHAPDDAPPPKLEDAPKVKDEGVEATKPEADPAIAQRRATSFLELGKTLRKSGNLAGAKKQFEKSIAADSSSDSAKEAEALLKELAPNK